MTNESTAPKPEPSVPVGWCDLDDYFARGVTNSNEKIRIHKHVSRTQVQFQDGTLLGTVFTEDKPQ